MFNGPEVMKEVMKTVGAVPHESVKRKGEKGDV
jgi:hypothetical protein